jgi:hypothetical protein
MLTMGDVKVTREHRLAAASLFPQLSHTNSGERWVMGDRVTYALGSEFQLMVLAAKALATAEARGYAVGRAAERADVVAWLRGEGDDDSHMAATKAFISGYCREILAYKPSMGEAVDWGCENLGERVERGEHVKGEANNG